MIQKLKNQNYFGIASFYENEVLTDNIVDNALRLSAYVQLKIVLNTTDVVYGLCGTANGCHVWISYVDAIST